MFLRALLSAGLIVLIRWTARFLFINLKNASSIPKEIQRFKKALKESEIQLLEIQENLKKSRVTEPLYIIDVHILILKDKKFSNRTIKYIRRLGINCGMGGAFDAGSLQTDI